MNVIKRTRTEFDFFTVEAQIKLVDMISTDIYFINTNDARRVYDELKNTEEFDDYNIVSVKDSHTLSIIGEVDVHYNKDKKILTIFCYA